MKKNKIFLIITAVLLSIAVYFFITNKKGTIREELRDFAVEDTASITKIFMVDKTNAQVTLERTKEGWIVNGKYNARQDAIDVLLKTIKRLDIKAPVSRSSFENVVKRLAAKSTKVEIFSDDDLIKTFYVGDATKEQKGTYMMLENSSTPFIMHIEGFTGYLSTRFFIEELLWRDQAIYNYKFNEIASITIENTESPDKSFKVINHGDNKYGLESLSTGNIAEFDTIAVKEFIGSYKRVNFERIIPEEEGINKDSLMSAQPIKIITLKDIEGNENIVKMYVRPAGGLLDDEGNELKWDPDRAYGILNNKDLVIVQYFVFDPLTKEIDYFLSSDK